VIIPSDEETFQECEAIGEAAVEARLKTRSFVNSTAAHEWLIKRQRESEHRRSRQEMRNTQWALIASWIAVAISLTAVFSQMYIAQKQRELMKEQLEQQRKDSRAQLDNAKTLLSAQISVEMDKQFDSPEMRQARRRLASELLSKKEVTETRLFDFFDKVAMYTHQHLVDQTLVYQSYSYWLERYYPKIKPSINELRKQEHDSGYYQDAEELYNEMLADDKKQGNPIPSKTEILRFLKEEAELPK
jgi:hypothetical protein